MRNPRIPAPSWTCCLLVQVEQHPVLASSNAALAVASLPARVEATSLGISKDPPPPAYPAACCCQNPSRFRSPPTIARLRARDSRPTRAWTMLPAALSPGLLLVSLGPPLRLRRRDDRPRAARAVFTASADCPRVASMLQLAPVMGFGPFRYCYFSPWLSPRRLGWPTQRLASLCQLSRPHNLRCAARVFRGSSTFPCRAPALQSFPPRR